MLIDKPAGPTSHDVVARVRRILGTRAAGHAGTLDPFATGLLVVLIGRATRLARFVERHEKSYLAEAVLGRVTDTDDGTGSVIARPPVERWPDGGTVQAALQELLGSTEQRPPAYSARKLEGQRAHRLARRGAPVVLAARPVEIRTLELLDWSPPVLRFRAIVSAGTYIRAIARDLGERLGTGAHLRALRRVAVGPFAVEDAVPMAALRATSPRLEPLALVPGLPRIALSEQEEGAVRHGRPLPAPAARGEVALVDGAGRLLAIAEGTGDRWQPRVVLEAA